MFLPYPELRPKFLAVAATAAEPQPQAFYEKWKFHWTDVINLCKDFCQKKHHFFVKKSDHCIIDFCQKTSFFVKKSDWIMNFLSKNVIF